MFKQVEFPEWSTVCAIAAFVLIAGVFLVVAGRAVFMSRGERDRLSQMPLDDGERRTESDEETHHA